MATMIVPISLLKPLFSRGYNVDATNLTVGVSDVANTAYYKSLVKFNFGVLPSNVKITAAKLVMTGYVPSSPTNFYIARNTSDFNSGTTYQTAPSVTGAKLFTPATATNQKVTYDLAGILDFNNIANNAYGLSMYVTNLNVYGYGHYYGTGTNAAYIEVTYNEAPTNSNLIPTTNIKKDVNSSILLNNYFKDNDGDFLTFNATSSNSNIVKVTVSGSNLTITGVALGTATITVTASDGISSTSQTFAVTVANTGPVGTTMPNQSTKKNSTVIVNLANYFSDVDNDALTYTVSSANTNIATVSVSGNILTIRGVSIGSALITVTASDSKLTASQSFTTTVTNSMPTVAVTAPAANVTLYENDLFNLAGQAADVDTNQSVTVYAQINNDQRIVLAVGLSNAPVTFNKSLKFVGGRLFDGEAAVSGNLIDGVAHTVKIWAQDGDGAQSGVTERTFYTVPNRPPLITVDTIVPKGIINSDIIAISGTAGDPDGNTIFAAYRVNNSNSVPLEINDGKWVFDITLAQLEIGQNTIIVEVLDTYNSKVSKTIKLNKNEVKTPILHSVARYKIEPPKGSAKGVLLWIQRDEDLTDLLVELSMTLTGEQENYVSLTPTNTAPVGTDTVEDEFYYEADEAKNHIILKLSTTREDINIDHKIHLISGVLE